jgi:hypothetical protein
VERFFQIAVSTVDSTKFFWNFRCYRNGCNHLAKKKKKKKKQKKKKKKKKSQSLRTF